MAANFPNSPTDGQTYSFGGTNYVYSTANGGWKAFIGVGQLLSLQVFTSSGTYTPTTGMEYCLIECVGSGGGGGGVALSSSAGMGGGGGGGSYSRKLSSAATIGASQVVTVGAAGTGGTAGANNGVAGGDVSVGSICVGKGGSLGLGAAANVGAAAGAGGVTGTGDFTITGQAGNNGSGAGSSGGGGDSGLYGSGGQNQNPIAAGKVASGYGGGGGGGGSSGSSAAVAGGDGTKGIVIITEYARSSPVPGVAVSVDNTIPRFDGTAGRIQTSNVVIADNDAVTIPGTTSAYFGLTISTTDPGTSGPLMHLYHNSASPAASDIVGRYRYTGKDSAGNDEAYVELNGIIADTTSTTEYGYLQVRTDKAGTLAERARFGGHAAFAAATATTYDFRVSNLSMHDDATTCYIQSFGGEKLSLNAQGNAVVLGSGQLEFPATQNASANANTLDDYEEGTFTPTFLAGGSSAGVTYSTQQGHYTKVGEWISIRGRIVLTNNGSGSGTAKLAGIPVTVNATYVGILPIAMTAGGATATGIQGVFDAGGAAITMVIPGAASYTLATEANCLDTFSAYFGGSYIV